MTKVTFITGDTLEYTVESKEVKTTIKVKVGEGITAKTINVLVKEGEKEADKVSQAIVQAFPVLAEAIAKKEEDDAIKAEAAEIKAEEKK